MRALPPGPFEIENAEYAHCALCVIHLEIACLVAAAFGADHRCLVDPEFWSLALIIAAAHGVQVVIGFGGSMLSLTFASLVAPVETLLPLLVPLNLGVPFYLVTRYPGSIDRYQLFHRLIPYALLGLGLGFGLFLVIDNSSLTIVYALFVIVLACFRLVGALRERLSPLAQSEEVLPIARATSAAESSASSVKKPSIDDAELASAESTRGRAASTSSPSPSPLWLVAGGLCHGFFATGGPVLILYIAAAVPDKQRFRCTMAGLWIVLNGSLVTGYALNGDLTLATLRRTASLAPALVVGVLVGEAVHRRISQETFKILIYVLLLIAGGLLLSRS